MWDTWKNISAIIVLAFLIAANPGIVLGIANAFYQGAVFVVGVTMAGVQKASEANVKDFQKPIPERPPQELFQPNQVKPSQYLIPSGPETPKSTGISVREQFIESEKKRLMGPSI